MSVFANSQNSSKKKLKNSDWVQWIRIFCIQIHHHSVLPYLPPSLHLNLPSSIVKTLVLNIYIDSLALSYIIHKIVPELLHEYHCQQQAYEAKFQDFFALSFVLTVNPLGVCSQGTDRKSYLNYQIFFFLCSYILDLIHRFYLHSVLAFAF